MAKYILLLFVFILLFACEEQKEDSTNDFPTHFELSKGAETATYLQTIDFYIQLAKEFPEITFRQLAKPTVAIRCTS